MSPDLRLSELLDEVARWDIYRESEDVRHFVADVQSKLAAVLLGGTPQSGGPIALSELQEQTVKDWAADDRLWTTQETVEINLRTFARKILSAACGGAASSPTPLFTQKELQLIASVFTDAATSADESGEADCIENAPMLRALSRKAAIASYGPAAPVRLEPQACRTCGGSGFVAEKRCIDDGYGEVDSCPTCVRPVQETSRS